MPRTPGGTHLADKETEHGKTYLTPAIGEYLVDLFSPETPGLQDAARAIEAAGMPQIQVSPWDGRILEILLRLVGARRVVELGTLGAYSAQWIARAAASGRSRRARATPRSPGACSSAPACPTASRSARARGSTSCRRSSATARSTPSSSTPTRAATPPTPAGRRRTCARAGC